MSSRGQSETDKLKKNLKDQVDRLMQQLVDLDEEKDELDEDEYDEIKGDTIEQLKELKHSLDKLVKGDMSLVDDLNAVQLTIQAAISEAFKTPQVISMFAKKQPGQLRDRLADIDRDCGLGKISKDSVADQKLEILAALKRLGEPLTASELEFLQFNQNEKLKQFMAADDSIEASKLMTFVNH